MPRSHILPLFLLPLAALFLGYNQISKESTATSFEIKPPITLNKGRIPVDRKSEFVLHGNSGQFLYISIDQAAEYDLPFSISAQMPDGSEDKPIDCPDVPIFPLRETGVYRVLFDPSGQGHSIGFALLPNNDPLIDPGIKPEQVSIDFGSFAHNDELKFSPYCTGEFLPARLALTNDHIWVRIMQVAGYERFFSRFSKISELQASLRPGAKAVDARKLPRPNDAHGAAIVMTARAGLMYGKSWRGWRWIEGTSGNEYPDKLTYVFQGISDDGRLFFVLRAPISQPEQQRSLPEIKGRNKNAMKEQSDNRSSLENRLNDAAAASFRPDLDQLDTVVSSLRFTR